MSLTPEQRQEFVELTTPLIRWLQSNCHPHVTVVVDNQSAELLEGIAAHHIGAPNVPFDLSVQAIYGMEQHPIPVGAGIEVTCWRVGVANATGGTFVVGPLPSEKRPTLDSVKEFARTYPKTWARLVISENRNPMTATLLARALALEAAENKSTESEKT